MHRILTLVCIVANLIFLAPGARAQDAEETEPAEQADEAEAADGSEQSDETAEDSVYARTGWYLGGAGVAAYGASRVDGVDDEANGGLNARIGWRESSRFAYEIEAEWILLRDISYGIWTYGVNAKFYPLGQRLQPFFLVGAGGMTQKTKVESGSRTDWGFRGGLGADCYLSENWALSVEAAYVWGVGENWQRDHVSMGLGALYRF